MQWNIDFHFTILTTLWMLGWCMISAIRFGTAGNMFESPSLARFPATFPPGWGLSLPWTYITWLAVVIAIYPACRWFADIKRRRRDWWLGYL
jgi:hypothetical protein